MVEQRKRRLKKPAESLVDMLYVHHPPVVHPALELFDKQCSGVSTFKVGLEFVQIADKCTVLGFVMLGIGISVHGIIVHIPFFIAEVFDNVFFEKTEKRAQLHFRSSGIKSTNQPVDARKELLVLIVNFDNTDR